jgi:hypothetical protein
MLKREREREGGTITAKAVPTYHKSDTSEDEKFRR